MARGVDGRPIFLDDHDYRLFLLILRQLQTETGSKVLAYCLMGNHFHLAIKTGILPLGVVLQRLLTRYAKSFNRKYGRKGHLFQDRFKSIPCVDDRYLLGLVRYIHMNPVRACLVQSPSDWHWSSYRDHPHANDSMPDDDFDPWLQAAPALLRIEEPDPTPLKEIIQSATEESGITTEILRSSSQNRRVSAARKQIARAALERGYPLSAVSLELGRSPGSIHTLVYGRNFKDFKNLTPSATTPGGG